MIVFAVLLGSGQRRPDPPPRPDPAHRSLPVCGGAELWGGGGDGEVQVGPDDFLQEQRRALRCVREELPEPAPAAAGGKHQDTRTPHLGFRPRWRHLLYLNCSCLYVLKSQSSAKTQTDDKQTHNDHKKMSNNIKETQNDWREK